MILEDKVGEVGFVGLDPEAAVPVFDQDVLDDSTRLGDVNARTLDDGNGTAWMAGYRVSVKNPSLVWWVKDRGAVERRGVYMALSSGDAPRPSLLGIPL